jgi:prepilin peptidase CpaA
VSDPLLYAQRAVLLGLLVAATYTDVRWRRIPNAITYPGMLAALALGAWTTLAGSTALATIPTLGESLLGWLACGLMMVACFVLFPGQIGGGDVKLIAMMGAFLGVYAGLEALLWTLVLGACVGLIRLVWLLGAWPLLRRLWGGVKSAIALGGFVVLSEQERETYKTEIFLAPCALAAVLIVTAGPLVGWV